MGYKLQENNQIVELDKHFMNSIKEIKEALSNDFSHANTEILISSDLLKETNLKEFHLVLLEASKRGVLIRVALTNTEFNGQIENMLKSIRAEIIPCTKNTAFIAIDRTLLWHGNCSIFSNRKSSISMMRIQDKKIISEMIDGLEIK